MQKEFFKVSFKKQGKYMAEMGNMSWSYNKITARIVKSGRIYF